METFSGEFNSGRNLEISVCCYYEWNWGKSEREYIIHKFYLLFANGLFDDCFKLNESVLILYASCIIFKMDFYFRYYNNIN